MKSVFDAYNGFRKIILDHNSNEFEQLVKTGNVIVPSGLNAARLQLPRLNHSYGLDVIKMDRTDGGFRISINKGPGELKGLIMHRTEDGSARISPILDDTRSLIFTGDLADGSDTNMLSDGNNWFLWSFGGLAESAEWKPYIYQQTLNGELATRESGNSIDSPTITGTVIDDDAAGVVPGEPQQTLAPTATGQTSELVDLLTVISITDGNDINYPTSGGELMAASSLITINGTFHPDVHTVTVNGDEEIQLNEDGTWSWSTFLVGVKKHSFVFRAFATNDAGIDYDVEIEIADFTLNASATNFDSLDLDLIQITSINDIPYTDEFVFPEVSNDQFPFTIVIKGTYHEVVNGLIENNRGTGIFEVDTVNLTWTYTEIIQAPANIQFSFTVSHLNVPIETVKSATPINMSEGTLTPSTGANTPVLLNGVLMSVEGSYVDVSHSADYDLSTNKTIAFWMKPTSLTNTAEGASWILSKWDSAGFGWKIGASRGTTTNSAAVGLEASKGYFKAIINNSENTLTDAQSIYFFPQEGIANGEIALFAMQVKEDNGLWFVRGSYKGQVCFASDTNSSNNNIDVDGWVQLTVTPQADTANNPLRIAEGFNGKIADIYIIDEIQDEIPVIFSLLGSSIT